MINRLTRVVAAVIVALLTASLLTAPAAQAAGPEQLLKGLERFQGGVAETTRSLSVAPQVGWDAGLESVRPPSAPWYRLWDMKVAWRDVNPAPGVFDWSILDRRIAQVESWGGRPLLVLGLTPQWAAKDPYAGDPRWGAGSASPPAAAGAFEAYVNEVSTRYGSRIGGYELWNEANLKTFWTGSAAELAEMSGSAYRIIKANSPSAVVLAPSVTTRLTSGARFSAEFLDAFVGKSETPFDAWAIHTYPAGNAGVNFDGTCSADPETGETPDDCISGASPKLAAQQRVNDVRQWQQSVISVVGDSSPLLDLPIWDTEINYGLRGPGIIPGVNWSQDQGRALINYTLADSASLGISNTFWYQFTASAYDLLGVQMTPGSSTTNTYVNPKLIALERTSGSDYQLPVIDGCRYRYQMTCPGADLKSADLSDSRMRRSNFDGADLYRVNLSGSSLRDSSAVKTRFFEANLVGLDGRKSTFSRSNMMRVVASNADFRDAVLRGVDFRKSDLRKADFRDADLRGVDFRDADLRGADLRGAKTAGANFTRAKMDGVLD